MPPLAVALLWLLQPPSAALPSPAGVVPWPPALSATTVFHRAEAGRLSFDATPDLVLRADRRALFAYGPPAYRAFVTLDEDCDDVCVVRGASPQGLDAVFTSDAHVLAAHWLLPMGGSFSAEVVLEPPKNPFAGSVRLRSADLDGDGHADLVGLAKDHVHFVRLDAPKGGGLPAILRPPVVAPAVVEDFVLVRWDADPIPEIAAVTAQGLLVLDLQGKVLNLSPLTSSPKSGALAVFHDASAPAERVAWVGAVPGATSEVLLVADAQGFEPPVPVPPMHAVGLAAADVDGDGDEDLLVRGRAAKKLLVGLNRSALGGSSSFPNLPSTWTFVPLVPDADAPDPTADGAPAVIDRDGDGDADAFVPLTSPPLLVALENHVQEGDVLRPRLGHAVFDTQGGGAPFGPGPQGSGANPQNVPAGGYADSDGGLGKSSGRGVLHLTVLPPKVLPPAATHLDLVVWREERIDVPTAQDALAHLVLPLPSSPAGWPLHVPVNVDERSFPFPAVYALELRFVALGSGAELLAAFPLRQVAFSVDDAAEAALIAQAPPGEPILPVTLQVEQGPGIPSSVEVGAIVPLPRIPDFDLGLVPRPDAQTGPPVEGQ